MKIYYLEIVTQDVGAVCAAYAAATGVRFGEPDARLGNAHTATLQGGGLVGVRAPMHETEAPVVRPYWLVDDIEKAVAAGRLAREEGLFAGTSTGANVVAALRVAGRLGPGATVGTLACDSGLKYLSTDLYTSG